MKIIVPDYYKEFKCIADKCTHNCCLNWEVDIDEETLSNYLNIDSDFGKRLKKNIVLDNLGEDECVHFKMYNNRCAFLNDNNLCDIISVLGEENLCQICKDHPRFKNYFTNQIEIGLGLACEEAGRIILSKKDKVKLVELSNDGITNEVDFFEQDLLDLRNDIFSILQNREESVDERILNLIEFAGLDKNEFSFTKGDIDELACEQLAFYLAYRHIADSLYDDRLDERIEFVAKSYMKVRNEWASSNSKTLDDLVEIARKFSEEVEYNTDTWGII